ncbi:gliding motility-associated C-terminal domain-containing protein [Chitinophaga agrisoli]|nr:gliding motility-associated C-terminal domain-containing protein [Chitinophaga agrisoli]
MRKYIFTLFYLLFLASRLSAQTDISIGTGTVGNGGGYSYPCPLQDYFEGSRSQFLYRASELLAAGMGPGMISGVKFNVTSVNSVDVIEQYTLKIAGTAVTTLGDDSWEPGGATVFGPVDYNPVNGINAFTFANSFFWNGTDNIIVEVCNGGDDWTGNVSVPWTTNLPFNASRTYAEDNSGTLCDNLSTQESGNQTTRPNIIFSWTPASACAGAPNGGTAHTSVSSVCLNESFNLSLTGATVASGLTYQWQSSPNNTTWTNVPGATTSNYTATQTATSYYRCMLTCTASATSVPSVSVQVTSPTLVAGTFSIDNGNPTNTVTGTFNSFNDAYNYIKCGINGAVVFNVISANPVHNEQLIMQPIPGASATNTVTFNGNGKEIAYTSVASGQRATIKLDGADHISFNNLVITASGAAGPEYGYGVQLINDADSNTVNNCTININTTSDEEDFAGIVVTSSHTDATESGEAKCDGNTFSNNTITGGYYGITLVGDDNFANGSNKIINNTIKDFYNYGMYISYSFNTLIAGNNISRPARTEVTDFYGIYLTNLNTKDSISRNRITDPFGGNPASTDDFYGIYFNSVDALSSLENIVSNNLVYNITGNGNAYGIYNTSSDNVYYYHNTLAMDGSASGNSSVTRGIYLINSRVDGINVINNIIHISRGGPGPKYGLYFGNTSSTIVSDRNVLFIAPGVANAFVGFFGADQATLGDWQTASSQDAGSMISNPMFTSPATGNYSPVNASIDNRGMPVGIGIDINNAVRSATTPDIGAYEFTPPPCTVPPTPGTATVGASPVCVNIRVPFGLTGASVGLTQTYQWQVSANIAGPFTNLGNPLTNADTIIVANVTSYYRVAVTCSGNTAYSTPVLLEVNQALAPDTYTIDKTAPVGTPKNYLSFNEAKAALECGIAGPVIFNVVAGRTPYEEQLILDSIPGASAVNTITFMGNGNTIHFSSDDTNERAVIKLRRADHFVFDSLTIDATGDGGYGNGVQLINNADSNIVRKCNIITDVTDDVSYYCGIVINAEDDAANSAGATLCDANTFERNTITGGYYGVSLVGDEDVPLLNNRFVNNAVKEYYSAGFYIRYTTNTLIEGNAISRPTRDNSNYTVSAIYIYDPSTKLTITRNRIFNPFGGNLTSTSDFNGIYLQYADGGEGAETMVANNVIYNINGRGTLSGIYHYTSNNIFYYHNTISLDDAANTSTAGARGFNETGDIAGVRFFNNIITITRAGNSTRYGMYLNSSNSDFTSDYNDIYVKGTGGQDNVGYAATSNRTTLADWQAVTSQDAHSISMDPVYADAPNGNLAPVISPLDNTGTPLGITIDVDGKSRSTTTPDIGAFEIAIPPCVAPPNAGAATALPADNVCMGAIISLSLNGNTTGGGQTYRWQVGRTATGPWRYLTEDRFVKEYKTELTIENYFRCLVMCGGDTAYSAVAHVNMNAPLPSGFYTINPGAPAGTPRNYNSFTDAVNALECGIAGWVTFNVSPGTYTEQVRMHRIYGASDTSRVTFQGLNHNTSGVILTFTGTNAANYVLQLDSASYITYKELTIKSNGAYARAVNLASTSSYDSLLNCAIIAPAVTSSTTNVVGVYGNPLKGTGNVIRGNTVTNGSTGIYMYGSSGDDLVPNLTIDSNTVVGAYQYNIYTYYTNRLKIRKNTIKITPPRASTSYGIYSNSSDTAYVTADNIVNIQGATSTVYGIYQASSDATAALPATIAGNKIHALTGVTGSVYGLYTTSTSFTDVVNNVISINTTGNTAYGIYATGDRNNNFYNNSVLNSSASTAATNITAYFAPTANTKLRNNIFAHNGGKYPLAVDNIEDLNSDYNTLYTTGTVLVHEEGFPDIDRPTLQQWRDEADLDQSSIVYQPAFVNDSTLAPDVANPDVWAIHGRGVQVAGNDHDINNQPRPTTLAAGVPDMGAYEFLPTAVPPVLPAIPAAPAPGITQTFMFGTDTVSKITWGPTVPGTVSVRRYSGVVPPNIDATKEFMYFYTDMEPGSTPYSFDIQQFYVDSWQGTFTDEKTIRLGRTTDANNTWKTSDSSKLEDIANIIADTSLSFLDKFTGLKGNMPTPPPVVQAADSSNRGTRFWVGYGHHQFFSGDNSQDMVLYLSAEAAANVTVRINGTSWEKHYSIPANTVISSDLIPKSGLSDARLLAEGFSEKGISIESDVPVVAYAHIYGSASSGATMLLPVGTYGYEYYTLSAKQKYGTDTYSWFYVIADYDNTVVEVTPSQPTLAGRPANVPFTVTLNKGEVYQVLGALIQGTEGYDLSGSRVKSIPNGAGKCYPVAVFSGSSRTQFGCGGLEGGGDNLIQQNFPSQAWGRNYLTAPTSVDSDPAVFMTNIFRVLVKDPATVVKRNGVQLTGIINNRYYEFQSNTGDYIQADLPVMVAQYMSSSSACDNMDGLGDPEMIYLSPIEQGINKVGLYRNTQENIEVNYLTLIIPTAGVPSLLIDGTNNFDHVYPHPNLPGYTVVVKRWDADTAQAIVTSDSAFTAITYGLGSVESYGYNAGTLVKNLNTQPSFSNIYGNGSASDYTCAKTPFRFSMLISVKPTTLKWELSKVSYLDPNADVLQTNPVPEDSVEVNGRKYFRFVINSNYVFSQPGMYYVPIVMTHPDIESCNNSLETVLPIKVIGAPVVDFTVAYSGCVSDTAQFHGTATTANGVGISSWKWNFGESDVDTAIVKDPLKKYGAAGVYNVKLSIIAEEGCIGDTTLPVTVNAAPDVVLADDSLTVCAGDNATFNVQSPEADITYNWYTAPVGGTLAGSGASLTIPNITATASYYVEAVKDGCAGANRTRGVVTVFPQLVTPMVTVDTIGVNMVRFKWSAVANATGYEVSIDNGVNWSKPSSGERGLTHTVTGLQPAQTVTLIVKAKGCEDKLSAPVSAKTLPDGIFIPNAFSPNGDGLNDELRVYGYIIKDIHFMIFNQWGEKVFETNTQNRGWDGQYKGRMQPSGVYIYVCKLQLTDGSVVEKKGAVNLIR